MAIAQQGAGALSLRAAYKAFNDRDRDALLGALAEDVTWHGPLQGTLKGRQEVWESFFAPLWQAPVRTEVHDILDNGEHVVSLASVVFDLPDGTRSWNFAEICHYDDAGRATQRWALVEHEQDFVDFAQTLGGSM
jgi:ketosteroid isomerase-like protein